jgi:adenylate kinase family enzyme
MKRVMILGGPGSGKSTLAKRLHALTGLPLYHLDKLHWRPGWTPCPKPEWHRLLSELAGEDEWIMDGGYDSTFHLRMPRADTVLWLDLPLLVTLPRVLKRTALHFGRVREDLAPGCPERIDFAFLKWAWTFRRAHTAKYHHALATLAPHATVRVFSTNREAQSFLASLSC